MNIIAWDRLNDVAISPERSPIDGEYSYDKVKRKKSEYHAPKAAAILLDEAKTGRIALVKLEAGERIAALDWQLQRADRHMELNKTPKKARALVLTAQQNIEDDSDLAEIAINALTTIEDVNAFNW